MLTSVQVRTSNNYSEKLLKSTKNTHTFVDYYSALFCTIYHSNTNYWYCYYYINTEVINLEK